MGERYIVGYDDSGPSRRALEWALSRAAAGHRPVVLAHVTPTTDAGADRDDDTSVADVIERAISDARRRHPDLPISSLMLRGGVVPALLAAADESDVLVVGTHKTGHLHGRALGTTGLAMAIGAKCSVVVVPDADLRFRRGVVAGVDAGPQAAEVCEAAAAEAEYRGDELVLVRATDGAQDGPVTLGTTGGRLQDAHPRLPVSCRTTARAVAPSLLDAALGHALLVIGAPPASEARAGHVQAVLHDVLINLTAPVLVARSGSSSAIPRKSSPQYTKDMA